MLRKIVSLVFLFLCGFAAFAQFQPTQFIKFDENEGFNTSNYIGDIKDDQDGNIWIINFNQAIKYDGVSFKRIKTGRINHNALLRFIEAPDGSKYVYDYSGLFYKIEGDSLSDYHYNSVLKTLNSSSAFTDMRFDNDGRLHISYNKTSYLIIDSGKVYRPLEQLSKKINGELIILNDDGSTFATFSSKGIYTAKMLYTLDENLNVLDSIEITKSAFTFPKSKTRWMNGVMYYSNGRGNFFKINKRGQIEEQEFKFPIIYLFLDAYNSLWVSTSEQGIYKVSDKGIDYNKVYFPNTTSVASEQDFEGGIWVYSYDEGLILMPYPNFEYINNKTHSSLPQNVTSIELVNDELYIANSGNYMYTYNLQTGAVDSIDIQMKQTGSVESIFRDPQSDMIWISQRGHMFYQKQGQWHKLRTDKLPRFNGRSKVKIIGYDKHTNCNIAAYDNYYFLFRDTLIKYTSPEFEDQILTLSIGQNSTYVSTYSGVYLQKGEQVIDLKQTYPELKDRAHSITDFDDQVIFSIKNGGLYSLQNETLSKVRYKELPIENALVIKVNKDSLWCFSNQGSFLFQPGQPKQAYDKLPEIVSAHVIGNANGVFWTTINKGVFHTPISGVVQNKLKGVRLKLNSIKINGSLMPITDSVYQVSYSRSFVQIDYQPLTFKDWPITYRYKMQGLNTDWVTSKEKSIQFTNLPIGEYVFLLQARKGEQVWSEPIEVKFVVLPPVWRKWWFIALSILFIALVGYLIISYRFKVIKREKDLVIDKLKAEQRALRAQMDPHFVFNVVASAQYLVMKEDNEKAIEFLNKFSRLMRSTLDHSNSNLITLDQELKFLENYISLERLRLEDGFEYEFILDLDRDASSILIPPFIIQPFIENSIHHGLKNKEGEKNLKINIVLDKTYLSIKIADNGIGRANAGKYFSEEKMKRKSHGIRIIKERLQLHNDKKERNVIYIDPEDGGTEVVIRIKTEKNESNYTG